MRKTLKDFSINVDRIRRQSFKAGVRKGLRMALAQITIPMSGNKARSLGYASRIRNLIEKENEEVRTDSSTQEARKDEGEGQPELG